MRESYLSQRGIENAKGNEHWAELIALLGDPWDEKENPNGIVILGVAENSMMHPEIQSYITENFSLDPPAHLTYGLGPSGSLRLRTALAAFFKSHFEARVAVKPEELVVTSGVSAATDEVTWSICDDGEGILIPQPLYTGFQIDIPMRSRGILVPAPFDGIEGFSGLNDCFDAELNVKALERQLAKSEKEGVKIRGVIITHPHNPLGKCYPTESLKAIAAFCGRNKLHLILDEIYAFTIFDNKSNPDAVPFKSILTLDLDDVIDPMLLHVFYGASKDFCANGLRLGVLYSRNERLRGAVSSINIFGWPSNLVQDMWAKMLEDKKWLDSFIEENRRRLAESYDTMTSFLEKHDINYFKGGNAGQFLWVDFRRFLVPSSTSVTDAFAELKIIPETFEKLKEKEQYVFKTFIKHRVFVGTGTNFFTEEVGWFRVSFTVPKPMLEEGLGRIAKALKEVEDGKH